MAIKEREQLHDDLKLLEGFISNKRAKPDWWQIGPSYVTLIVVMAGWVGYLATDHQRLNNVEETVKSRSSAFTEMTADHERIRALESQQTDQNRLISEMNTSGTQGTHARFDSIEKRLDQIQQDLTEIRRLQLRK